MYESELEIVEIIMRLNALVEKCASGEIKFDQFIKEYGYPIGEYALDGHESNEEGRRLIKAQESKLRPHILITERILNYLCSEEQAKDPAYIKALRIGPEQAFIVLREIASEYGIYNAT